MKKILTIIIDGFGMKEKKEGNAPKEARMDNFNTMWKNILMHY